LFLGDNLTIRALRPVDTIAQTARQITAADDLGRRIPYESQDELGQLTKTFNQTLERLERLFNAQRRFVADVSHEMRTPLTTIRGNISLMRRIGYDEESVAAIDGETQRMTRLVEDLLLLAKADAGRLSLEKQLVELDTLVLEVYNQAHILSEDKVSVHLGQLDQARVMGDSDRLKQLLLNLVSNGLKYTPEGGDVTLSLNRDDEWVRVDVTDTGVGIPAEDLPHIFDRFYRVDKARSRVMGGTGLGLSIAHWIAEAHGGQLSVVSEVGKGSTFTVKLPLAPETVTKPSRRDTVPNLRAIRMTRQT
jgi:two-component system OmpR family sensor kinase